MENKKRVKTVAYIFISLFVAVGVIICGALFLCPYDDGTLAPYNSSANLSFSGRAAATSAYELYTLPSGGLYRYTLSDETSEKISDDSVTDINPADGAVYYISDGKIISSDYLGLAKNTISGENEVVRMSVNGYWVYFTDCSGKLFKMRRDGSDLRDISPEGLSVERFSADNRSVIFMSGDGLYSIKSDGTGLKTIASSGVDSFQYSRDNIFYRQNGMIKMKFQYVSEYSEDLYPPYSEIEAEIYNYCFDADGNGLMYYVSGDTLMLRKLYVIASYGNENTEESDCTVMTLPGITELYRAGDHLYAYTSDNSLYRISLDGSYVGTSEKIE